MSHILKDFLCVCVCVCVKTHSSVQFSSVAQSCLTICKPMDCSIPGLCVYHQLPEFTQTHVHWVGDAIQSSQSFPTSGSFPMSQLFLHIRWPKYWSFSFNISPSNEHPGLTALGWTGWISMQSNGLSRVSTNTTVQKHQFFGVQFSSKSNSHIHT